MFIVYVYKLSIINFFFFSLILVLINCVTGFPQEPIKLWFGNGYDGVKGANGAQEPNKRWFGNGYDGVKGANGAVSFKDIPFLKAKLFYLKGWSGCTSVGWFGLTSVVALSVHSSVGPF